MGKARSGAAWRWVACLVLVAICVAEGNTRKIVALTADAYEISTEDPYHTTPTPSPTVEITTGVDNKIVLDYISGGPYPSSVPIEYSSSATNPTYYITTVRSGGPVASGKIKILLVLENMVCDPRSASLSYLWIKHGSGNKKHFCENLHGEIISKDFDEVMVGISEFWHTDNNATLRATAYYDSEPNCKCQTSLSFCCKSCEDFTKGYCINKDFNCRYKDYCPYGVSDIPDDEDNCDWFPDNDEDMIRISMSLMVIYLVLAVCLAVAITYLVPRFCRDRWQRRSAADQPDARADAAPAGHPDAECPPPSYESMTAEEFSLKHLQIPDLDEPPPPSYETLVQDAKV